jgi:hypothetical protein
MIPKSSDCLEHADEAEDAAQRIDDAALKEILLKVAESWRRTAQTYQFVEDIESRQKESGAPDRKL